MPENEIILTTCPRDCYDACGIAVIKQSGVIKRVRGDPNNPINRGGLCGKCAIAYNGVIRDPNQRLKTPLKRVGPKGLGQFQVASWDEAIQTIAERLQEIVAHSGPEAILNAHYTGTMSRIAYAFPLRFFNRQDAQEVDQYIQRVFSSPPGQRSQAIRRLFVEKLDFTSSSGLVSLAKAPATVSLPENADRIASLQGLNVVYVPLNIP